MNYTSWKTNTRQAFEQGLLNKQGHICAVCKDSFRYKRPVLDHCHQTGKARAMVCRKCNLWLGMVEGGKWEPTVEVSVYLAKFHLNVIPEVCVDKPLRPLQLLLFS